MFDLPLLQFSSKLRGGWNAAGQFGGWGQWVTWLSHTGGARPGFSGGTCMEPESTPRFHSTTALISLSWR